MSVNPRFQTVLKTEAARKDMCSAEDNSNRYRSKSTEGNRRRHRKADLRSIPSRSPPNPTTERAAARVGNKSIALLKRDRTVEESADGESESEAIKKGKPSSAVENFFSSLKEQKKTEGSLLAKDEKQRRAENDYFRFFGAGSRKSESPSC
jgi:hypothetical protein